MALFGVSSLPNKNSENPAAAETRKSRAPFLKTVAQKSAPYSPCTEIAKRLRRFVANPSVPLDSWQLPNSCYDPAEPRPQTQQVKTLPEVHFAIATVPDPLSTHLSLLFDRIVESTQQAAQDDNYSYDSSWFPWDSSDKDYPLLGDQQAAEELQSIQQSQPGVMIFRRALHRSDEPYGGGLVIFLVGEQPTGGLRDEQFENALAWITQLGGLDNATTLRILGPTFSGSLPSLQLGLQRFFEADKQGRSSVFVSSGTVSAEIGPGWFGDWLAKKRPNSYFRTAMERDSVMVNRFCQYLRDQRYKVDRVAFLSEDETAFGRNPVDPQRPLRGCDGTIDLYYPRDIATLRSAYQQQAVLNSAKSSSAKSSPSTTLRGDLSEPATSNHDTVRSYGGQLTPLAQEAILLDIVNRLKQNEIQFIVLRSTSSLDQIFLSEFLRRSYAEGRIVIDGADLLFNRGSESKSLRGVMMLSTYPLLTMEQDWTSPLRNSTSGYRTFAEDTAEAVYIAARELLLDDRLKSQIPIHDYTPPAWASTGQTPESLRPATWISVIGRRQFWPVAVINSDTMGDPKLKGELPSAVDRGDEGPVVRGQQHPLYFPTAIWMALLSYLGWSWFHFYFCRNGSIMGSPRALAYFAPVDRRQHAVLIALGSVLLAMLAITLAVDSGICSLLLGHNPFRDPIIRAPLAMLALLVTLAFAVAAYVKSCDLSTLCAAGPPTENTRPWRRRVAGTALLALLAYCGIQAYLLYRLTPANQIPAYWRSLNLFCGVSPLLPELLLLMGAYLWFWCNLRGLAHFGEDRPLLPALEDLPAADDGTSRMPMFSCECAGLPVENEALPLTRAYILRMLKIFGITTAISAVALQGLWVRTLGELEFGALIFFWICLSVSVILADAIQTWRAWAEIRQLLVYLDRLPLRRTLRSLKGLAWGSIWKMGGNVLEERYRAISLQIESLRHLKNCVEDWVPDGKLASVHKRTFLAKSFQCEKKFRDFANWYIKLDRDKPVENLKNLHDFQKELAATAGAVMANILLPAWEKEKTSLLLGRPNGEAATDIEIPTDGLKPHVRAAEEFFVLPYLAFIQNILGRFRTIALGSLWLFIGATLAVSSYPFDPLNVLGAIFLTVFAIGGGMTILVYSQMSRDATLSHITNTKPGELGLNFWMRLLGFGIGPLLGLLTTLFPSITDFAFSWLQPSVEALK